MTSFNIGTPTIPQVYFITAYDSATNESGSSNFVIVTPAGSLPPPPPPLATIDLTVVGNATMGMWGVEGSTMDFRDVMAIIYLDGVVHNVEHRAPYGFPADNGMTATTERFGNGSHEVEFVFFLEGTATEIGRANVTVQEGSPSPAPVSLRVAGNPAAGMWGVEGYTMDLRDVMATIYLDGVVHHVEHRWPYGFPDDNGMTATMGRFGSGLHRVEYVFSLEGTTTEIGRANITVREGSL